MIKVYRFAFNVTTLSFVESIVYVNVWNYMHSGFAVEKLCLVTCAESRANCRRFGIMPLRMKHVLSVELALTSSTYFLARIEMEKPFVRRSFKCANL